MSFQDFCEDEFNKKALELHKVSEILNDNWKISETNQKFYLSKKQTISIKSTRQKPPAHHHDDDDPSVAEVDQEDLIAIEYHVLFHPSYQVPCLYFNAYSDCSLISLQDISKIFVSEFEFKNSHDEIHNIITQAEHPILFKPFFMVHPCKVHQVLSQFTESKNLILTFLTLFGPSVQLKMNSEYENYYYNKSI